MTTKHRNKRDSYPFNINPLNGGKVFLSAHSHAHYKPCPRSDTHIHNRIQYNYNTVQCNTILYNALLNHIVQYYTLPIMQFTTTQIHTYTVIKHCQDLCVFHPFRQPAIKSILVIMYAPPISVHVWSYF